MIPGIEQLRADWSRLAEASGNVFATPEWADAWLAHARRVQERPAIVPVRLEGEVRAILPLTVQQYGPLSVARFVGHGAADELGPVCAPEDRAAAAQALREQRFDVLLGEQLRGDVGWEDALGGRVLRRTGSPVIRFEGRTWDELLAGWSSNFRQRVRREPRRLAREQEVQFRLADAATLDGDLDTLFRLHAARWRRRTQFLALEPFHRVFARSALERGWLRIWVLELGGTPAAVWYGLRFAGAESYYQAGRDPSWERYALGLVLLAHSIRTALEDGQAEYRFLRGGEEYKYRFTSDDPGLLTLGVPLTTRGRAALAAGFALDRVRLAARAVRARR